MVACIDNNSIVRRIMVMILMIQLFDYTTPRLASQIQWLDAIGVEPQDTIAWRGD